MEILMKAEIKEMSKQGKYAPDTGIYFQRPALPDFGI